MPSIASTSPDRKLASVERGEQLVEALRWQAAGCAELGCPFYERLCTGLIADVQEDGAASRLLAPFAGESLNAAYVLRFLGGLHRLVLAGSAPALAAHYPSVGGDGDAAAALDAIRALADVPRHELLDALTRPPQTNEVGRSIALASGLLHVARHTARPLRLREIGTSGALNLRPELYWYEQAGQGWGNAASPVRFIDLWEGATPPLDARLEIVDRRGCDPDPIDVTSHDGALTLMSYVWPEPASRFARARAATELAPTLPVTVDRARAEDWLPHQLDHSASGTALVVYHSVMWQYLKESAQDQIRACLYSAGADASPDAPLAWLRLEPHPQTYFPAELRLALWDGSATGPGEQLLATTGFHGGPITWLGA
jgi:hypothetical protein